VQKANGLPACNEGHRLSTQGRLYQPLAWPTSKQFSRVKLKSSIDWSSEIWLTTNKPFQIWMATRAVFWMQVSISRTKEIFKANLQLKDHRAPHQSRGGNSQSRKS